MTTIEDFFEFYPNHIFAEYMKFYVTHYEHESYKYEQYKTCADFPIKAPIRAVNIMNNEVTPRASQKACYAMEKFLKKTNIKKQIDNMKYNLLPLFEHLGDVINKDEVDVVFLKYKYQMITYKQIEEAFLCYTYDPVLKFAIEMSIDMFNNNFGAKDIIESEKYNLKLDIINTISFSENAKLYTKAIFEAVKQNEEYIIPTLVNIVIHAYETVKAIRGYEMHNDEKWCAYEQLYPPPHSEDVEFENNKKQEKQLLWKKYRDQTQAINSDDEDLVW